MGEKVFTVELQYLDTPASGAYEGGYQHQLDFPEDQFEFITNAHTVSLAEVNHLPVELGHIWQRLALYEQRLQGGRTPSLAEIAALHGFRPLDNIEDLVGGWPEGADLDSFLKGAITQEDWKLVVVSDESIVIVDTDVFSYLFRDDRRGNPCAHVRYYS